MSLKEALPTKKDLLLIVLILLSSFILLGVWRWFNISGRQSVMYAEITSADRVDIVDLNDDRTFSVFGAPHVIFEVRDRQIAFVKSDCPDQICVREGFLNRSGQMAACLPNNILLFLLNHEDEGDGLDIFVR